MIGGRGKSNNNKNKNLTQFPSINRGIEIHKTLLLNVENQREVERKGGKPQQRGKEANPN